MDDRIHAWLDGELPFEALSEAEQAEARAVDARIGAISARLASAPTPDLTSRVLGALEAQEAMAPARPRRWPSLRSLLPAGGLAPRPALAMAAFALVVGFGLGTLVPRAPEAVPVADAVPPQLFVRFELEAGGATEVRLAGSFSGWEARHELTPVAPGRWSVTVPLEPGVHDYVFVVDGEHHVVDPHAPRVSDGFGGYNSRLALLKPQI